MSICRWFYRVPWRWSVWCRMCCRIGSVIVCVPPVVHNRPTDPFFQRIDNLVQWCFLPVLWAYSVYRTEWTRIIESCKSVFSHVTCCYLIVVEFVFIKVVSIRWWWSEYVWDIRLFAFSQDTALSKVVSWGPLRFSVNRKCDEAGQVSGHRSLSCLFHFFLRGAFFI